MKPRAIVVDERLEAVLRIAREARFYTVVSLLERLTPDAQRVGGGGPAAEEALRFRHSPELGFSAGDVERARLTTSRPPADPYGPERLIVELTTTFLGLTGSVSPLPLYIAEEVLHESDTDPIRRDFLDVFHHRLVSLLYRLWSRYGYARELRSDLEDRWSKRSLAIVGLDTYERPASSIIPLPTLMRLLPLLTVRTKSARVLELAMEQLLDEHMANVRVRVKQFVGGWTPVDDDQRCELGKRNNQLGVDTLLGARVFDRTGHFALSIGPVKAVSYTRLLRGGDLLELVREGVRLFTRDSVDFDLELQLAEDAVPSMRLGARDGSKLGQDAWLRGRQVSKTMTVKNVLSDAG